MKNLLGILAASALFFGSAAGAHAQQNLLSDHDFSNGSDGDLFPQIQIEADDIGNDGDQWVDRANWQREDESNDGQVGEGLWARHVVPDGANNTDTLQQGIDASSIPPGAKLKLKFDYICDGTDVESGCSGGFVPRVQVWGLDAGEEITRFDPSRPCHPVGADFGDTCDDDGQNHLLLDEPLDATTSWAKEKFSFNVPRQFVALAVVFRFGADRDPATASQGVRGVDNVVLKRLVPKVRKYLVSGPLDNYGAPLPVIVNPLDDGGIRIKHPDSQHFKFVIKATRPDETDWKLFDVVPAEFDPDEVAEGLDGEGDATPDGIAVIEGDCGAEITPRDPERQLDPHFIRIVFDESDTCKVAVWVKTSENPASVKKTGPKDSLGDPKEKFSPTGCNIVMENGMTIYDTFTLNEGVKVFDPDSGFRVRGPEESLQLTCNFGEPF